MGRWRWKIVCPCLLCALVVLLAIHGSKGPYSKLHPVLRRILSQLMTGSPAMNAHSKLLDSSSFPLLQSETIGSYISPSPQPQPVYVEEPHSNGAPSPLVDTEGSVQTPQTMLPKSVILPPVVQAFIPSMQPSCPPDPVTAAEKPPSLAPDIPSPTATSRAGVPGADYHGKTLDVSSPVMTPVAQVSPPSIEFPLQKPAKLPEPALSPTSYTPPATNRASDGIAVVAPPNISHLLPSNSSHAKVPVVSPTSLTPPAISGNRYRIPVPGLPKELPSHLSPANYSQPKGLAALSPDNHVNKNGSPVAARPKEPPDNHVDKNGSPVAAPPKELSIHGSPENDSHQKGPATSPVTAISPAIHENYGVPVASPPIILPNHSVPINYSHAKEPAVPPVTVVSPSTHENHGIPVAAPPADLSNYSTPPNHSHASGPLMPPVTAVSPAIHQSHSMPVAAPPKNLQNHTTHLNYSHPKGPAISPVTAGPPSVHENNGIPVAAPPKEIPSHSPPVNDTRSRGSFPVMSPAPHAPKLPSDSAHAPHSSHPQPPKEKAPADSPSPISEVSSHKYTPGKRIRNPSSAPSPLPPSDTYHPAPPSKIRPKAHAPPPYSQVPSHSVDGQGAPAPTTSEVAPPTHHNGNVQIPVSSPPGSIIWKPLAPVMQPIHALPPPPPSLDCTPLNCFEPYTNSRPGSPCTCVMPIKVGLRLNISLFTFFPLVFGFAQEIASGIPIDQSQVRIMGANADADPDKTIVLIYLVPLGYIFENETVFSIFEKFWHKQVFLDSSLFVDAQVLYVTYPGLPPSPPVAPRSINVNDGTSGGNTLHPFAVDVRKKKGKQNRGVVAVLVISAVIAFILCVGAIWLLLLKCRARSCHPQTPQALMHPHAKTSGTGPAMGGSRQTSASVSFTSSILPYAGSTKTFSIAEMEKATNNFDELRIIGEGGFGRVYEGTLEDGSRVAIKVLKRDDQQGNREFLAEVEMLSRLHHRNLIKLIGICIEEHNCLVYELVPNSSVESHLHGTDKESAPLNWATRLKIALGAARGLAYLHEDSSPRVIHRDFKSSNILLEDDFTPKVSDFGLARTAMGEGNEYISTRVMGTFGYVAPEYAMTGHLLVKSDVYSYGVVLLELLTGRKPVDMLRPPGQENLVTWARPLLTSKDGLESIVDPSLGPNIPFDSLAKVAAIASMCVQPEVDQRPFMGEVVQALKLVCNEGEEGGLSESCNLEETSTMRDIKEPRTSTEGWDLESQKLPSEPEMLSISARYMKDMSGSFRRYSSSGPLRRGSSSQQFFHRTRALTSGSASEHGTFDKGLEVGDQWV